MVTNRPHAHRVSFAASCNEEVARVENTTVGFYTTNFASSAQVGTKNAFFNKVTPVNVPCGSLSPLIQSLLGGKVDFFSLDVEGAEPLVLEHIDLRNILVDVFMVESMNRFCKKNCASREAARKILLDQGYFLWGDLVTQSDVYVHPKSVYLREGSSFLKKAKTPPRTKDGRLRNRFLGVPLID